MTKLIICISVLLFPFIGFAQSNKKVTVKWCDINAGNEISVKEFGDCNKLLIYEGNVLSTTWKIKEFVFEFVSKSGMLHKLKFRNESISPYYIENIVLKAQGKVYFQQIKVVNSKGEVKSLPGYTILLNSVD